MRFFIALVLLCNMTSAFAFAHKEFSAGAGLNMNFVNAESSLGEGVDNGSAVSVAFAAKEIFKIKDQWFLRTGLWLQEKTATIDIFVNGITGSLDYNTLYASIPLTLQHRVRDELSLFGGYIADFRLNDYCEANEINTCTINRDSESVVHVATVGASVNLSEKFNLELSYQHGLTDTLSNGFRTNTISLMGFYRF